VSCFTINAQVLNFKALEVDSGGNPTKEIFLKNVQITIKFLDSALMQLRLWNCYDINLRNALSRNLRLIYTFLGLTFLYKNR